MVWTLIVGITAFLLGYIIGGEEAYSAGYSAGMLTATAGMRETQRQAVQRVEERRKVGG